MTRCEMYGVPRYEFSLLKERNDIETVEDNTRETA